MRLLNFIGYALIAFLAFALATAAQSCPIWMPPAEYDHPPSVHVDLVFLPYWQVDQACRALGVPADGRMTGCTSRTFNTIILPLSDRWNVSTELQACILRHEMAHINGWPADHPGAV